MRVLISILIILIWFWASNSKASDLPFCKGDFNPIDWSHCQGTWYFSVGKFVDGGISYSGEWKNGDFHGQGTWEYGGDKYIGTWKDNKRHGQGTITFANGEKYVGEWKDGKKNGEGIQYYADGSIRSQGVFKDNEFTSNIPPNAYASGDSWKCKSGYEKLGNTCKEIIQKDNYIFFGIEDSWIQIISKKGELFYSGMLLKDFNLSIPNDEKLFITLANAGAVGIKNKEFTAEPIGQLGEILQAVDLNYILEKSEFFNSSKKQIKIPKNAYGTEDNWNCIIGYKKKADFCEKIKIPKNAIVYGDTWKCKSGYFKYGDACLKIPNNAYALGDSWKCKSGYEQSGNTCKKKPEPKKEVIPEEVLQAASGTGFIVSETGHIVTNHHVIEGCAEVKVHKDGDIFKGKVIANDILNDLALIKSNYKPNVIFPLRDKNPSLLEDIYVAGFPFGNAISSSVKVTKGVVSSESGIGNNYSNIQIDAALQPGNSGGPILDSKGNAIGVAVAKLAMEKIYEDFGVFPENTNFGIKSSVVENLIQAHNVNNPSPHKKEMNKSDLGYNIKQATLYLSCWMTLAQIKKFSTKKVIFRDLVN